MSASSPGEAVSPIALRGSTPAWGVPARIAIAACVALGLWLRLRGLAAEGFADDEIHKWLAAIRYLHGDFGGDDVEHPMLMKSLVALAAAVLPRSVAPEAITRLPNALAGAVSIWATAQLGRRLFGRAAGLVAAGVAAASATFVGYQRIAKEDTLLGLFLLLVLWCFAEAKAASTDGRPGDRRRWENAGAIFFGAMLASKYYLSYFLIPVLAWAWVAGQGGGTWQLGRKRWLALVGISFAVFAAINWTPFMPSTWRYFLQHSGGEVVADRFSSESLWFMGRLWGNLAFHFRDTVPVWFYPVFFAVKLAPPTLILALAGLGLALWRRAPAERVVLVWMGVWALTFHATGAKYGRMTLSVLPALFLLAGHAAVSFASAASRVAARLRAGAAEPSRLRPALTLGALAIALVGTEGRAAAAHAPHYRLYVNAIGGGDRRLAYFFPHCDYFDAGLREAVAWIAAHAEYGAEVCSEVEWPVRYYAVEAGRRDFATSTITRAHGCRSGRPCYVIVQAGRLYSHNQAALERLSRAAAKHVEWIRGAEVVKVYRLEPTEPLFPDQAPGAPSP